MNNPIPTLSSFNRDIATREFEKGATVVYSRPNWITLDPGAVCNLRCVQCPRENPAENFVERKTDPEMIRRVIDTFPYLERLSLIGLGEPLLSDVFWSIVEDNRTKEITKIDISTNGTLLSERNIDRLLASNLTLVHVSIDGATDQTYQRIRGGNLQKVIRGVKRLTDRRNELKRIDFTVWVTMTLMVENIRELPLMVELAHSMGVDVFWAQHLVMKTDGSQAKWRISRDGWNFVYDDQYLINAPALSNEMVRQALAVAQKLGLDFELDPALWLPE